jgi:hypothetical protein
MINKAVFDEKWKVIRGQSTNWWGLMAEYDLVKVDKADVKFDKFVTMLQVHRLDSLFQAFSLLGVLNSPSGAGSTFLPARGLGHICTWYSMWPSWVSERVASETLACLEGLGVHMAPGWVFASILVLVWPHGVSVT